jgi:Na+/proline symporter
VAAEIWRASNPEADHSHPAQWRSGGADAIIALWWGSFFVTRFGDHFAGRYMQSLGTNSSLDAYLNANLYILLATAINILALIVAIIFVYRLSSRQEQKFEQISHNPFPFDPPTDFQIELDLSERLVTPREKTLIWDTGTGL